MNFFSGVSQKFARHTRRARSWNVPAMALAILAIGAPFTLAAQQVKPPTEAASDPILRALQEELTRSKAHLKMENVEAPFYIEYRVFDVEQFDASAAFGAMRDQNRTRLRLIRAVVRLGDYKLDSFINAGQGVSDILPLDSDELAIRHQVWLATDQAYKRASEAFSNKKAMLKQLNVDQPVGPVSKLDVDTAKWTKMLESATAIYKSDPQIQSMIASVNFTMLSQYFVNTEGTVTRHGAAHYQVVLNASEQAPDGMRLERSPQYTANRLEELPTPEEFQKDAVKLIHDMKTLREAPLVEEEYRGPVLFSSDASTDMFFDLVVPNVLGRRPPPGRPARTVGAYASSWKARVLPDFMTVVDDPTVETYGGRGLGGSYRVDDEGVAAGPVTVIDNGTLTNYLLGRVPLRDFPASNGHGRATGNGNTAPAPGNLFFRPSKTSTRAELKKQLLDVCRTRGLKYGYYVDTLGPRLAPRMLYRVWTDDGHEELVRGAVFNELDIRALRGDLVAAGDDPLVSNRTGLPFMTVVSPSVLFDELEVKRADSAKEKLPDYPAPALTAGQN
jgi:predicted Zn-dependent protease